MEYSLPHSIFAGINLTSLVSLFEHKFNIRNNLSATISFVKKKSKKANLRFSLIGILHPSQEPLEWKKR